MKGKEMPGSQRGNRICHSAGCTEKMMRGLLETDSVVIRSGSWARTRFTAPPIELR